MRHGPLGMIYGRRLREPYVACVARELTAFEGPNDGVAIANLAPLGVHEISPTLHFREQSVVKEVLRFRMKRRVDGHDVADLDHVIDTGMPSEVQFLLNRVGEPVPVVVVKMHVEGLQAAEHRKADAAGGDCTDVHALDIIRPRDAVGDIPAAPHHQLVGRYVVADSPRIIITTCSETLIELL